MGDASPSRPPLLINLDETAIVRHVSGIRGTVVKPTAKVRVAIDRASLSERRTYISLLACVTDDETVQGLLPQVLLGNYHVFTLQVLRSLSGQTGSVTLWRQPSAWNCHATMRKWLTLLTKALGPLVRARTVIVVLDVHPSHIHASIFQHARNCGVRFVYIPAKLTWLLQPCDTHVFAPFKRALQKAWLEEKSKAAGGKISLETWLKVVCATVGNTIIGTAWRKAFLADGLLARQTGMSSRVAQALGFDGSVDLSKTLPTEEQASCIFPARVKMDMLGYLTWTSKAERKKREAEENAVAEASASVSLTQPSGPMYKGRVVRTLD